MKTTEQTLKSKSNLWISQEALSLALSSLMQRLEKEIQKGNKLNFTRTIIAIKEIFGNIKSPTEKGEE